MISFWCLHDQVPLLRTNPTKKRLCVLQLPLSTWVFLTRVQLALQSLRNGWHIFLCISLTIIILSQKLHVMKHTSSVSIERITVDNLRLKKRSEVMSLTHIYFWNLHAGSNSKTIIKEKKCFFSLHFHLQGPGRCSVFWMELKWTVYIVFVTIMYMQCTLPFSVYWSRLPELAELAKTVIFSEL